MPQAQTSRRQKRRLARAFVAHFKKVGLPFFSMKIPKVAIMGIGDRDTQLEIPTSFLRAQFHMFEEINGEYEVTLTTAGTRDTNEEWPVFLTEHPMPEGSLVPSHVYAFGKSGWADFATDNDIQVGDLVVFQLVDISCFQVFVMPKV